MPAAAQSGKRPAKPARNIIIFVADGLRYGSVTPENAPHLDRLKREGVDFTNSHSLFPTVTTVNASAIATGHYIGDTGNFGNAIYAGQPLASLSGSPVATLENDAVLAEMNQKFGGNYLNEQSLLAQARAHGFATAAIGKLGPMRIQDLTAAADSSQTLLIDDNTGNNGGFGLPDWFTQALASQGIAPKVPGATLPDVDQENWLMKATTGVVLPHFAASGKPFALLFWSRDPDATQHGATDSVGKLEPGINGPTALAAVRNADTQLGALLAALKAQGLDKTTDIFVTADHGFLTIDHASTTSPSLKFGPQPATELSSGFLAVDLASVLRLPLFDPANHLAPVDYASGAKLTTGAGLLGDPQDPDMVVVPNGGAALIYLRKANAKKLAGDIVTFLTTQDYASGLFVDDGLGRFGGALHVRDVGLRGMARTPKPSILVSFASHATCSQGLQCAAGSHDTGLKTGQGSHGSLSRAETRNFMAAIGPDFKTGFADPAPISNADIAPTLAQIAGIPLPSKGEAKGRVIREALVGGKNASVASQTIQSAPAENGARTILNFQQVNGRSYFDAAGVAGKTVGLTPP
jgi:arylsulfatase A-like enzyme